jgi:hypothetical protein
MHEMKRHSRTAIRMGLFLVSFLWLSSETFVAFAQGDMFIYPKEGQSDEQLEKDKYECYGWAKKQTGFDPMAAPQASAPPPQKEAKKGGAVKGAARGAVAGVAIGAIAGDAGKGAAIGATGGALFGGMRRRGQAKQQKQAENQWAQEQADQYEQNRSNYNRGYAACLEARGYTVK